MLDQLAPGIARGAATIRAAAAKVSDGIPPAEAHVPAEAGNDHFDAAAIPAVVPAAVPVATIVVTGPADDADVDDDADGSDDEDGVDVAAAGPNGQVVDGRNMRWADVALRVLAGVGEEMTARQIFDYSNEHGPRRPMSGKTPEREWADTWQRLQTSSPTTGDRHAIADRLLRVFGPVEDIRIGPPRSLVTGRRYRRLIT